MDKEPEELDPLLESVHEDVSMTFQVSLTMSKNSRDILARIRDELNATSEKPVLETNDIIRLALIGATRYDDILNDPDHTPNSETEEIAPLLERLGEEVRNDPHFDIED